MNTSKISAFYWVFFGAALVFAISIFSVGWNQPISDLYPFRQTQTAISAYYINFAHFFDYETPVLGPPWSIPFEFPLFQGLVKALSVLFHYPLDQSGRLVSVFFFFASFFSILGTLRKFKLSRSAIILVLGLYLISPVYLFWSRTFMIESTALFLSLSYFWAALCARDNQRTIWIFLTVGLGILAALVKITTFFPYAFALGVYLLIQQNLITFSFRSSAWWRSVFFLAIITIVPLLFGISWTKFADHQKLLNPFADFITSSNLFHWNFGTLDQKLSVNTWSVFYTARLTEAIGSRYFLAIIILSLYWATISERIMIVSFTLLYFFTFMVFTNLHFIHSYYQTSCAVLVVAALALSIHVFFRIGKVIPAISMLLLVIAGSVYTYQKHFFEAQKHPPHYMKELGSKISQMTEPNDVLLVYGLDWSSELPYYSNRRAIMDLFNRGLEDPAMVTSLKLLSESHEKIAILAVCGNLKKDESFIQIRKTYFDLTKKASEDEFCVIYSKS